MRTFTFSIGLLGAATGLAHANGFVLNEHGARATGRGNAVVATDTTGSSLVHNPGGFAAAHGTSFELGGSWIIPTAAFHDPAGNRTGTDSGSSVTPHLYITSRVYKRLSVALGVHAPFGSRISWPANSPSADEVREQQLRTLFITPALGMDLSGYVPGLSIGAGFDVVPSSVVLKQDIPFAGEVGSAHLGGNGLGYGGRVGLMYRRKALSLGVAYKSPVKISYDGKGDFDAPETVRTSLPPDGDISTAMTLPQSVSGGIAYRVHRRLELEVDAVWMDWSSIDKLVIALPGGAETISPRDYTDTVSVRAGIDYKLPENPVRVRAGYHYDPTPVPETRLTAALPDMNRHVLSTGLSYTHGRYNVDAGLLWVLPTSRKTDDTPYEPLHKGTYELTAVVASLTLGARFGGCDGTCAPKRK